MKNWIDHFIKVILCCELDDFVSHSENGFDTYLGDRGVEYQVVKTKIKYC